MLAQSLRARHTSRTAPAQRQPFLHVSGMFPAERGCIELKTVAEIQEAYVDERGNAAVEHQVARLAWERGPGEEILEESLPSLESGDESPYSVAARIVRAARGGG